jgi:hypothetical protein
VGSHPTISLILTDSSRKHNESLDQMNKNRVKTIVGVTYPINVLAGSKMTEESVVNILIALCHLNIEYLRHETNSLHPNEVFLLVAREDDFKPELLNSDVLYRSYYRKRPLKPDELWALKTILRCCTLVAGTIVDFRTQRITWGRSTGSVLRKDNFLCLCRCGSTEKITSLTTFFSMDSILRMLIPYKEASVKNYWRSRVTKACLLCDKNASKHCIGCYVPYCSKKCQLESWKTTHKTQCAFFEKTAIGDPLYMSGGDKDKRLAKLDARIDTIRLLNRIILLQNASFVILCILGLLWVVFLPFKQFYAAVSAVVGVCVYYLRYLLAQIILKKVDDRVKAL